MSEGPDIALAAAWGMLAASPLVVLAGRAGPRARVRTLRVRVVRPHRRRFTVPGPLAAVVGAGLRRARRRRYDDTVRRELPVVLDLLQVAVGAGATPRRAVELARRWGPPETGAAFAGALVATEVGSPLADALDATAVEHPTLAPVTTVLVASERLGAPAAPALTRLALELRADLRRRAEARARTLPVKLLFPLVFLVLPAFGLLTVAPALLTALART